MSKSSHRIGHEIKLYVAWNVCLKKSECVCFEHIAFIIKLISML